MTSSWRFAEVLAGTGTPVASPNGLIDPGEGVRLILDVSFSPPVGSTVIYNPPPPPGVGTVAGLAEVFFDLLGGPTAQGTWSNIVRAPGWAIGSSGGSQAGGAEIRGAAVGQFILPGATANAANPITAAWQGTWTPTSYATRTVTWQSRPAVGSGGNATSLLIQFGVLPTGEPQYVGTFVAGQFGSVAVPIVPAPGVGVVALAGAAALVRRRSRRGR
ncbi:MAG: hypothetical protein JNM80_01505 [Phycisphaerae bacterium]|nr:hypothetical protein [Phycisphaerae bacterium]